MAIIEGISITNYGVLRAITLGGLGNAQNYEALTPLTAVIGKNGVGKSTLFDAFGFLSDCLRLGVEEACDGHGRGGLDRIRSQGIDKPIIFVVSYRPEPMAHPIIYHLVIDKDEAGRPYVSLELLLQQRDGSQFCIFFLVNGGGMAWKGYSQGQQIDGDLEGGFELGKALKQIDEGKLVDLSDQMEMIRLHDNRRLGIATLGGLKEHPRIAAFREFIEGWYLSYFTPDAARGLPLAGPQRRLSVHGDNLGNVVQYMERENKEGFDAILEKIAGRVPGIQKIDTDRSPDGRLLLRFNDRGFQDPFYAQQMSDGTLKVFAYLLLLADPNPPPFICIEEPENGLYPKLLEVLAAEFRAHASGASNSSQIFVTTHQPYLVDALTPEETWILEKQDDGFATIRRASDDPVVRAMVEEGLTLGNLWYSNYLDKG